MKNLIHIAFMLALIGESFLFIKDARAIEPTQSVFSSPTSSDITRIDITKVPLSVYSIRSAIPAGTKIFQVTRGLVNILEREEYAKGASAELTDRYLDSIYSALTEEGYTINQNSNSRVVAGNSSVFNGVPEQNHQSQTMPARFYIGGTIHKFFWTCHFNGFGYSSDIDMRVKWELYDDLQKKVILTQEEYAVDDGGGCGDYPSTVMKKVAKQFFHSDNFKSSLRKALTYEVKSTTPLVESSTSTRIATKTDFQNSIVRIELQNGHGSGFAFTIGGKTYVATNHHVVKNASRIVVRTRNNQTYFAQVIKSDPVADLAVLNAPGLDVPVLELQLSNPQVGDSITVIGNPNTFDFVQVQGTISRIYEPGELHFSSDEPFGGTAGNTNIHRLYQVSGNISPGNSGSPVISRDGKVIGIISWGLVKSGLTMAIPATTMVERFSLQSSLMIK